MKGVVLALLVATIGSPVWAKGHHGYRSGRPAWSEPSGITCATVRAYVSQVGLAQAKALARANGMTAGQERRARQCLARSD